MAVETEAPVITMTLHRANRVQDDIKRAVGTLDAPEVEHVSVFDADPQGRIEEITGSVRENINRKEKLLDILGRIRCAVGKRNAEVGINDALARKNVLDQRIKLLSDFVEGSGRPGGMFMGQRLVNPDQAKAQVDSRREYMSADAPLKGEITFVTTGQDHRRELADRLLGLRRELEEISEKLRKLNDTTEIQIDPADVEVLQNERII